ncbi:AAA family ATPase [Arthrobacter sp. Sa2BUA2]|uniref:AAA family ATPase n=1 Tax=Arthrobacter pullicola TaxID=2762224 RepID=A0ABR8YHB0_9MICC|nr:AAA family ATPase [Arthrobacter pullicola]MBD8043359.1 AAA family ATPase [Arthrobacter pullicola]
MPEYSKIDDFLKWAAELAVTIDWVPAERPYKIELAERLSATRQMVLKGEAGWLERLLDDLSGTNLVNWRSLGNLKALSGDHPEELRTAVEKLWVADPSPFALTSFVENIRELSKDLAPGNLLALGTVLLTAVDPASFPPYRATPASRFLKLIDAEDVPTNSSPASERYEAFITALDALIAAAPRHGLNLPDRLDAQGLVWLVVNYSPPTDWAPAQKREFLAWRNLEEPDAAEDFRTGPHPDLEEAAAAILTPGLAGAPSPFDADVVSWNEENARDLYRRVYEDPDAGAGTFMGKLEKQLAGASRGVVLLTAELIALQCLPLTNLRPETKLARVEKVLSWTSPIPAVPDILEKGLRAQGAFNGGTGFNVQLWRHLCWLCDLVISLHSDEANAAAAVASPQGFHDVAEAVEGNLPSIRYSLEYMSWPGFFVPVVNWGHRKRIRNAFAHEIEGASGDSEIAVATDLHLIRTVQERKTGQRPDWYAEPYLSQWKPAADPTRAWLIRQSQGGVELADRWTSDGFVSLEARYLDTPTDIATLEDLQSAVDQGYEHLDYPERGLRARAYHAFLTLMKPEDLVLTVQGQQLSLGIVNGPVEHRRDDPMIGLVREVAWQRSTVSTADLAAPFPSLLEEQGMVVDLTEVLPSIRTWLEDDDVAPAVAPAIDDARELTASGVPVLREVSEDLAEALLMEKEDLQEVVGLLQTRNQIVFYGPPGTGKTFLAGKIARYLAGEEHTNHVTTVQFHPSYAYEDFFEGYRPVKGTDGQVSFALTPGPLRRIAADAAANRGKPYFLIIDEMNRGNLAKVFGELYFLLEYRDQKIDLQYNSAERFVLPPNLFIIGTMNTADRSIAMVDAAIRRRFAFVELHPQEGMTSGLLERFLEARGLDSRPAQLLNALNAEIAMEDRDLMIGPSYFMKEHSGSAGGLKQLWKYELLPLLEEHYYGRMSRPEIHERFGLAAIERKVDGTAASAS